MAHMTRAACTAVEGDAVAGPEHMDLAFELQRIYNSEINIRIGWLWDSGIDVYLGDGTNGYVAHENVQSAAGISPAYRRRLPTSTRSQLMLNPSARTSSHPRRHSSFIRQQSALGSPAHTAVLHTPLPPG